MKKILVLLLAIFLVSCACGCSSSKDDSLSVKDFEKTYYMECVECVECHDEFFTVGKVYEVKVTSPHSSYVRWDVGGIGAHESNYLILNDELHVKSGNHSAMFNLTGTSIVERIDNEGNILHQLKEK